MVLTTSRCVHAPRFYNLALRNVCIRNVYSPDWCGSAGGVLSLKEKGHWFYFQTGHMAWPAGLVPDQGLCGGDTNIDVSLPPFLSPSPALKISK